ncbi:MAG: Protein-methionine-sulfoxide reductase heme-binding subunit MsrQ [Chloroflexi bacterium]|jgi:sulfoxide reductase heme-binding subunit YedZ|nr:Protein-methionine-sulfoxide reductase heme-binding subunit MsrQ [Chloroflexota bacterium]
MPGKFYFNNSRLTTNLVMLFISLVGCYLAALYGPTNSFEETLSIGLGYVSLVLLAVTLMIGPFNLLRKRKNPVNINFRRDVGIWSGITACLHVVFSFQIYPGKSILNFFVGNNPQTLSPTFGLFELSNNVGLVGTLIMLALLVTSNQVSLKLLKGKRWKTLQRFNYLLGGLVVLHTIAFQSLNARENAFYYAVIGLTFAVIIVQLAGVAIYTSRAQVRRAANAEPAGAVASGFSPVAVQSGQITMARRRFLTLTGSTLLAGVAVSGTAGYLLGRVQTGEKPQVLAQDATPATSGATTGSGVTQAPSQAPAATPTPAASATAQTSPATATSSSASRRQVGSSSATTTTQPASPATTTPAASSAASQASSTTGRSLVLGNFASLPTGSALKFTTPDTGETAFVIHEQDGSVKAYSGICTHRPYTLVFDQSQQALMCDLHNVPFNIITGAPTRRPANSPLKSFKVHVDSQSNIIYDIV